MWKKHDPLPWGEQPQIGFTAQDRASHDKTHCFSGFCICFMVKVATAPLCFRHTCVVNHRVCQRDQIQAMLERIRSEISETLLKAWWTCMCIHGFIHMRNRVASGSNTVVCVSSRCAYPSNSSSVLPEPAKTSCLNKDTRYSKNKIKINGDTLFLIMIWINFLVCSTEQELLLFIQSMHCVLPCRQTTQCLLITSCVGRILREALNILTTKKFFLIFSTVESLDIC